MSDKLCIPEKVLDQHAIVLGKTGAGKSSALRHVVEHLLARNKRTCIIDPKGDWWGLRLSADGKGPGFPVITFGDFKNPRASDVPINAHAGKDLGELISTGNRPCIIGFRGWMTSHMVKFWIDFAPTLFGRNSGELYLVGDEFHNFAPKGKILSPEAGLCLHWSNRLLSEGRGLGIVCLLASQRPQKVHNDTLTSCETLIAMRVVHAADRAAVKEWIEGAGDPEQGKLVLNSLANMARGEAYVWSPEIHFGPTRLSFPMFKTFDSFAPPQLQKKVSDKGWADVDLAAVREKLSAVIEDHKANDPGELRKQIAELKRVIGAKSATPAPTKPAEPIHVPVLSKSDLMEFKLVADGIQVVMKNVQTGLENSNRALKDCLDQFTQKLSRFSAGAPHAAGKVARSPIPRAPARLAPTTPARARPSEADAGSANMQGGLRRMMVALAQRPQGLTKKQLGVRAGLSSSSGTFGTYLGRLRSNGWVLDSGSVIQLTDEGLKALGTYHPLPSGDGLVRYWLNELGSTGAARMLEALYQSGPMTADALGQACGMSPNSGTFGTYLGRLRTLELVTGPRHELRVSEELFKE